MRNVKLFHMSHNATKILSLLLSISLIILSSQSIAGLLSFNDDNDKILTLAMAQIVNNKDNRNNADTYLLDTTTTTNPFPTDISESSTATATLPGLYSELIKSVVEIHARDLGQGNGFVYDNEGHIVTNQRIVADTSSGQVADFIDVVFSDGFAYKATVVGTDSLSDIAVLYVGDTAPREKLFPLPLGNSSNLRIGEQVVAMGSPIGFTGS